MHGIETINKINAKKVQQPADKPYDEIGNIIAFEQGDLDEDGIIELFQHLVDNGHAWSLQGSYGRAAAALLDAGVIVERRARA